MSDVDNRQPYQPEPLKGLLPVSALMHYIPGWLERHWPELNEDMRDETVYHRLNSQIKYHVYARPIRDAACIDGNRTIHLFENYFQLLLCVCYAQVVLYQEGWQKSIRAGNPRGFYDSSIPAVALAYEVLAAGESLIHTFDKSRFEGLPMPTEPVNEGDELVGKANNMFVAAGVFIVMHEYAHHWYDHVSLPTNTPDSHSLEYRADELALDLMKRGTGKGRDVDNINALGVIATMTSLMLLNPQLDGNDTHPALHERYWHALNHLNLEGADDIWINAGIRSHLKNS